MPSLPIRRALSLLLAVLTLVVALPATQATAKAPDDDFKWSVLPSSPKGPTVRSRFEYGLKPGEEVSDWVAVGNLGKKPLKVAIYATDAFNASDGGFALLPASEQPKDVGSWIKLTRNEYTVPVGKRVDIPFKLKVPANAEPGDHIGGLIASATESTTNEAGQQVNVERRVAARVYLRVDGPAKPAAEITKVDVQYDNPVIPFGGGDMTVTYQVANTGNVRFSGKARIQVRGLFGVRMANTEQIDIPELLPDSEIRITKKLEGVFPAGRLTAEVTVNPQVTSPSVPSLSESRSMWAIPWLIVILIVLIIAAIVFWLVWRRRARRLAVAAELDGSAEEVTARARGVMLAAVAFVAMGTPLASLGAPRAAEPGPAAGTVDIEVSVGPAAPTASPTTGVSPTPSPSRTDGDDDSDGDEDGDCDGNCNADGDNDGGGNLARTGVAVGAFVVVGAALVGGGAGLRVLGRRRLDS